MSLNSSYWKILFVGEDKEKSVTELVLIQHALQFLSGLDNTITIVGVDDEDDTLGVLVVVAPEWSDLVLTTNVPHGELNVLVLYGLNVEAWLLLVLVLVRSVRHFVPIVGMVVLDSVSGCFHRVIAVHTQFHRASTCTEL